MPRSSSLVRTHGSQPYNTGSNPVRGTILRRAGQIFNRVLDPPVNYKKFDKIFNKDQKSFNRSLKKRRKFPMKTGNNKHKARKSTPSLFSGTHLYYAKFRPGIPEQVIDIIVNHFKISPNDRILDIGCGTGQVAIAMEGRCSEMVCVDPDPEMLKQAERITKDSKTKLIWINRGSQDLGKIKKNLGTFKVATSCRAFHRMNQEQVLKDLDDLIEQDGGVAIFSDRVLWSGDEEWQQAVKGGYSKIFRERETCWKRKI